MYWDTLRERKKAEPKENRCKVVRREKKWAGRSATRCPSNYKKRCWGCTTAVVCVSAWAQFPAPQITTKKVKAYRVKEEPG
jgi:hypothetical protein